MIEYHTIPVPRHMAWYDAWFEIDTLGRFHGYRWWKPRYWFPTWITVRVEYTDDATMIELI